MDEWEVEMLSQCSVDWIKPPRPTLPFPPSPPSLAINGVENEGTSHVLTGWERRLKATAQAAVCTTSSGCDFLQSEPLAAESLAETYSGGDGMMMMMMMVVMVVQHFVELSCYPFTFGFSFDKADYTK